MATVVSSTDIPPGGEGKIKVKVSTRGRKGKLRKTVSVYSNDPDTPRFPLKIQGQVEVVAGFEPQRINLKHVPVGETVTQTAKVTGKDIDKLEISDLTSSRDDLKAELIEEDGRQAVKITLTAKDKPGRFSARVTAKTNLDKPDKIQLFVYGHISQDLVVDRSYVFFPTVVDQKNGGLLTRALGTVAAPLIEKKRTAKVKVSSLSGKPFRITGVTDPEGAVLGTVDRQGEDWYVHLMLVSPPQGARGKVKLHTDRDDQEVVEVRYSARRPRGIRRPGRTGGKPKKLRRIRPTLLKPTIQPKQGGKNGARGPTGVRRLPVKPGGHSPSRAKPLRIKPKPPAPEQ